MTRTSSERLRHCDDVLRDKLTALKEALAQTDVTFEEVQAAYLRSIDYQAEETRPLILYYGLGLLFLLFLATPLLAGLIESVLSTRCFLPNNYLIFEATRPISDCSYCRGVRGPIVLPNATREEFAPYAYKSQPIIVKRAVGHWPAVKLLNYSFLKELYERTPGALDEDCQFLPFKSDFSTLREVFEMSEKRAKGEETPWYVGFSNCHPTVLKEMRKLYPIPHFLPDDAEVPNTDFIFFGYEQGAIMHIDYISRLMWQAQLIGRKNWVVAPTPECEEVCESFNFYVEEHDALLVDTRLWYHGTNIPNGQFSLTVQSEYG